jgi:hypothetical protein
MHCKRSITASKEVTAIKIDAQRLHEQEHRKRKAKDALAPAGMLSTIDIQNKRSKDSRQGSACRLGWQRN